MLILNSLPSDFLVQKPRLPVNISTGLLIQSGELTGNRVSNVGFKRNESLFERGHREVLK